jgi:hypothetical protein
LEQKYGWVLQEINMSNTQVRRDAIEKIAKSIVDLPKAKNLQEAKALDYAYTAKIDALESLFSTWMEEEHKRLLDIIGSEEYIRMTETMPIISSGLSEEQKIEHRALLRLHQQIYMLLKSPLPLPDDRRIKENK